VTRADGTEDHNLSNFNPIVVINPIIKEKDGEQIYEEGCLSVPGVYEEVKRAQHVIIEYYNMWGEVQILDAEELKAVCIQHENDHLDGIVFLERLSILKKKFAKKKYLRDQEQE
jgi:peptide deformylase